MYSSIARMATWENLKRKHMSAEKNVKYWEINIYFTREIRKSRKRSIEVVE